MVFNLSKWKNTLLLIIAIKVKTGESYEIEEFFKKNHHDILSTLFDSNKSIKDISEIRDIMLYSNYYIRKYIAVKMSKRRWKLTDDDMLILMKLLEYKCPKTIRLEIFNKNDPWMPLRIIENFEKSCDFTIRLGDGISGLSAVENRMGKSQTYVQYLIESFNHSR